MFTFFTTLLDFSVEYNIEKKQLSDVLPSVVFVDTKYNVLKISPDIRNKTFKILRSEFTHLKKDNKGITKKIDDWYHTRTSSNIDQILSVIQEKKNILSHFVIPIHNDNHFVIIDIFVPSHKITNGQVTLYDYLDSGDKAKT